MTLAIGLLAAAALLGWLFTLRGRAYDPAKIVIDRLLAAVALLVLSPVLALAALAIRFTSRGPILYHAPRAGRNGRRFLTLKFRTMVVGADRGAAVTVGGDARITAVGRVLRATKIDELPQLWNILRGEMAIVGPRPESLAIVERYYDDADREALSVLPGLTCPGNLLYYVYHESIVPPPSVDPDQFYARFLLPPKLLADRHYVRYRSLAYDLAMIVQTVRIMAGKLLNLKLSWTPRFIGAPPPNWRHPG